MLTYWGLEQNRYHSLNIIKCISWQKIFWKRFYSLGWISVKLSSESQIENKNRVRNNHIYFKHVHRQSNSFELQFPLYHTNRNHDPMRSHWKLWHDNFSPLHSSCMALFHLPLDKMAAILADVIFKGIFLNEKMCILIKISLKFVPKGPIDNIPALVQIMVWRQIGDKPLSEPMLAQFTDAYIRH